MFYKQIFYFTVALISVSAGDYIKTTSGYYHHENWKNIFDYCKEIGGLSNFDGQRFQGAWALVDSTFHDQERHSCMRYDFLLQNDTDFLFVHAYQKPRVESHFLEMGYARIDETGNGHMAGYDFQILSTDYDTYAIIYNCEDHYTYKKENVWILMRNQPTTQTVRTIQSEMKKHKLHSKMIRVDHSNCDFSLDQWWEVLQNYFAKNEYVTRRYY